MKSYTVTVTYSVYESSNPTVTSIVFKRYANSESAAISTVSALFGALSNYADSQGNKYMTVLTVNAAEIS